MFQTQLNRSSVDLKISVFTWKTLPAAVVTVTQFAAKVFMLMKHAKLKKKKSLHNDKFYAITTLYVYK